MMHLRLIRAADRSSYCTEIDLRLVWAKEGLLNCGSSNARRNFRPATNGVSSFRTRAPPAGPADSHRRGTGEAHVDRGSSDRSTRRSCGDPAESGFVRCDVRAPRGGVELAD